MQQRNGGALRARLESELRHAPQVVTAQEDFYAVLTEEARTLAAEFNWPFLRRTVPLLVFPDITIPAGDIVNLTFERTFFVEPAVFVNTLYPEEDTNILHEFMARVPGALLDLADRTRRGDTVSNFALAPFEVEFAQQDDADNAVQLYVDPRCKCEDEVETGLGDFKLWWPRYRLPGDVGTVLAVRDTSVSPPRPLGETTYDVASLRFEQLAPGDPVYWCRDTGHPMAMAAQPYVTPTSLIAMSGTSRSANDFNALGRENLAPVASPAFTAVSRSHGSGALATGRYRVFVAWAYAGRVSPASETVEVRVTQNSIRLSGLPFLENDTWSNPAVTGRMLQVWVSQERGPFYLHGWCKPEDAAETYDITALPNEHTPWGLVRWDETFPGGPYLRLYPRPSSTRRLEVDYSARVRDLSADSDGWGFDGGPEWDDVVLWRAVARLLARYGQPNGAASGIASERLRALCRRHGIAVASRRLARTTGFEAPHPYRDTVPAIPAYPDFNFED